VECENYRPVVKGPSGGTLLFRFALPARSASDGVRVLAHDHVLCLGAACTECINRMIGLAAEVRAFASALPARGASAKADKLRHTIL